MNDKVEVVEVVPEHSPVGESRSNGAAENAIKRLQGQLRTFKLVLAHHMGQNAETRPNVWHRMVEFAADTFNRHRVGEDGVTPYKRVKERAANTIIT